MPLISSFYGILMIEIHHEELAAAWQLAVNGLRPGKIAPLQ